MSPLGENVPSERNVVFCSQVNIESVHLKWRSLQLATADRRLHRRFTLVLFNASVQTLPTELFHTDNQGVSPDGVKVDKVQLTLHNCRVGRIEPRVMSNVRLHHLLLNQNTINNITSGAFNVTVGGDIIIKENKIGTIERKAIMVDDKKVFPKNFRLEFNTFQRKSLVHRCIFLE